MASTTPQWFRGKKEHREIIIVITLRTFSVPDTCIVSFNLPINLKDKYRYYIHVAQEETKTSEGLRTLPQVTHLGNVAVLLFGPQSPPRAGSTMIYSEEDKGGEADGRGGRVWPLQLSWLEAGPAYKKQEGDSDDRQAKKVKTKQNKQTKSTTCPLYNSLQ